MSNVILKNQPKVTLEQVLKRRKVTLKEYVKDVGVQTYGGLVALCARLGVTPPGEEKYMGEINPPLVTSQQDGVVVISSEDTDVKKSQHFKKNKKIVREFTPVAVEKVVNIPQFFTDLIEEENKK